MTIDTHTVEQLRAHLAQTYSASLEFQPLLSAEFEALKAADLQALTVLIERKKALTDTLLEASQNLLNWCAEQNIEPDYNAFEAWSSALPDPDRSSVRQSWLDLRQSLDENNRSTAVNRQVLSSLSGRNQARLTLLKNMLGTPATYTASGTQEPGPTGGWVDRV